MKTATISASPLECAPDFPETLPAYLDDLVKHWPQGKFIEINRAGETEETRYEQIHARSQLILSALQADGTKPDDTVILLLARASDHIAATWACIYGGFGWIPWSFDSSVNNEMAFTTGLKNLVGKLDAPLILTCSVSEEYLNGRPDLTIECAILNIDSSSDTGTSAEEIPGHQLNQETGTCLVSTSGTTGIPKLASLPQQVLLNRYAINLKSTNNGNTLHFVPLHSISSSRIIFPVSDFTVYMQPARLAMYPHEIFEQVESHRIQIIPLLTSHLAALLIHAHENRAIDADLSSLKRIAFGSDFIVPSLVTRLLQCLHDNQAGVQEITFVYGMTECGPICLSSCSESQFSGRTADDQQAVEIGKPADGWQMRITDDCGELLEEEQVGHIEVWSDRKLFSGYLHDREKQVSSFQQDGWFRTGDMGLLKNGRLTITGRESTKISVGSGNLSLQQIEAVLCDLPGLYKSQVMAAAVRVEGELSDEVVVIFVPDKADKIKINDLCREITRKITEGQGVRVKELVAVSPNDFQRTATGKIQRKLMLNRYLQGEWSPIRFEDGVEQNEELDERECYLLSLWKRLLKLDQLPPGDVSFFNLGGDSLSSAVLITEIERKFKCELPLSEFYQDPTVNRLLSILARETKTGQPSKHLQIADDEPFDEQNMLHAQESYVGVWKGSRQYKGSLIVGKNTSGRKAPLFFVFQGELEFLALAKRLGPNQPVYGMRSLANILPVKEYTADRIEALVNRYMSEILEMPVAHPVFLGGHCQGGIIALSLAKKLKRINKAPALLVLMEWSYSFGKYTDPVLLIYGRKSYTTGIFSADNKSSIDWKGDFPNNTVSPVTGNHENFLQRFSLLQIIVILKQHFFLHGIRNRALFFPWRRRQPD